MTIYTTKAYGREFVAQSENELFDMLEEYEDVNGIEDIIDYDSGFEIEVKD